MELDPNQLLSSLRLVRPPSTVQPTSEPSAQPAARPSEPVQPAQSPRESDTASFEAVYRSQQPKAERAEADQRMHRIRDNLVAANTDVPIHFQQPRPARSANPYVAGYLQHAADPASRNASAIEAGDPTNP